MARRLLAGVMVAALVLLSVMSENAIIVVGAWIWPTATMLGMVVLTVTIGRALTSRPVIPTLVALVVGIFTLCGIFLRSDSIAGFIPTWRTVEVFANDFRDMVLRLSNTMPPVEQDQTLALSIALTALVAFCMAELLAVGCWAPAWSGLAIVGLWVPAVVLGAPVATWTLIGSAALYAALIALLARDEASGRRRSNRRGSAVSMAAVVAVTVVAMVAAPLMLRLPAPVRWHPFYELTGVSATRLDLDVDLRDDLRNNSNQALFSYSGAPAQTVGPLHSYTLSQFDGSRWLPEPETPAEPNSGQLLFGTDPESATLGQPYSLSVSIDNLAQDRLLLPGEPRSVTAAAPTTYLPAVDEVSATVGEAISYDLQVSPRVLDEATLSTLQPDLQASPEYLQVPQTGYQDQIADFTRNLVAAAGAQTPYEQVLAIQNYLRNPAEFVYTTEVPAPTTPDAVWDFLNDREGYCVQFATAMIVMVRSLGIPARMAVGFLPGQTGADGVTSVAANRAHAWPQVLFEGVGWVRFEPTPAVQTGAAPSYAPDDPTDEPTTATPTPTPTTATSDAATTAPTASATPGATADGQQGTSPRSGALVGLALLVLLGFGLAAVLRRHTARAPTDPWAQWMSVLPFLSHLGVDTSPSRTLAAIAADAAPLLDADGARALTSLADAVQVHSYARRRDQISHADLARWQGVVIDSCRAASAREKVGVR